MPAAREIRVYLARRPQVVKHAWKAIERHHFREAASIAVRCSLEQPPNVDRFISTRGCGYVAAADLVGIPLSPSEKH